MSQIFGPPPPLGRDFDENVARRIAAKRRRRQVGAWSAVLVVIALTGAAIVVAATGHSRDEAVLRTASAPNGEAVDASSTDTTMQSTSTAPSPTTVTTPAPPSSAPATAAPPSSAPPATASGCPAGFVSAMAEIDAERRGSNAQGVPTWYVSAVGTIANGTPVAVDASINVFISDATDPIEHHPLALDPKPEFITLQPWSRATIQLVGYEPLAADGSNAVAAAKPNVLDNADSGSVLRRWHDPKLRASCPPPGAGASFKLTGPSGGQVAGWPGM
jgi:hypothetical protein